MIDETSGDENQTVRLPNGAGVAAVVAAGFGAFAMAVLAILGDHSAGFKKLMMFYTPTGPLSGVTTTGIVLWLLAWVGLGLAWRRRNVNRSIAFVGLCLLAIGFVFMFPPIGDLF